MARVGQAGRVLRSRAVLVQGEKWPAGKGKRLGLFGDRVSAHGCGLSALCNATNVALGAKY